ncbi:MAG TPA: hypothetical protein VFT53_05905 [Candidatus Saccharimonadales bacterium]|nr:hypothetical protein [Candidatus Saccharimonadales bacterium]
MAERLHADSTGGVERMPRHRRRTGQHAGNVAVRATEASQESETYQQFQPTSITVERIWRNGLGSIGYVHFWMTSSRDAMPTSEGSQSGKEVRRQFYHVGNTAQWRQSEADHLAWVHLPPDPETGRKPQPIGRQDLDAAEYTVVARLVSENKVSFAGEQEQLTDEIRTFLLLFEPPQRTAV